MRIPRIHPGHSAFPTAIRSLVPLLALAFAPPLAGTPPEPLPGTSVQAPATPKVLATFLLVKDKLAARVYAHTLETAQGPLPCWTYVTEGMRIAGQKEMLLTIQRDKDEDEMAFDRFLPRLFTIFYQLAEKGQRVDVGGYSQIAPGGLPLLGREDFLGILYIAPQAMPGVPVEPDQLAAVLVTEREVKLSLEFGQTRILARLGLAKRYFPTPPWSDRHRPEVVGTDAEEQASRIAKTSRDHIPGAYVRMENEIPALAQAADKVAPGENREFTPPRGRLVLTITSRGAAKIRNLAIAAKDSGGVCLLAGLDPKADACMVWRPGVQGPSAIAPPGGIGDRVSGNHLFLAGGREANIMRPLEDGYAYLFTKEDWTRVIQALTAGESITIPGTRTEPSFVVVWQREAPAKDFAK